MDGLSVLCPPQTQSSISFLSLTNQMNPFAGSSFSRSSLSNEIVSLSLPINRRRRLRWPTEPETPRLTSGTIISFHLYTSRPRRRFVSPFIKISSINDASRSLSAGHLIDSSNTNGTKKKWQRQKKNLEREREPGISLNHSMSPFPTSGLLE